MAALLFAAAFAREVGRHRRLWKLSMRELAVLAGLSHHAVASVENGTAWPDLATVGALTYALGLRVGVEAGGLSSVRAERRMQQSRERQQSLRADRLRAQTFARQGR